MQIKQRLNVLILVLVIQAAAWIACLIGIVLLIFDMAYEHTDKVEDLVVPVPHMTVYTVSAADLWSAEADNCNNPSPLTDDEWEELVEVCKERNISPALALGLIQTESGFDGDAVSASGSGAYGYCQLVPKWHPSGLSHTENIRYGLNYLADLCEKYGSTEAGLTAYNAGYDTKSREYANRVLFAADGWDWITPIEKRT